MPNDDLSTIIEDVALFKSRYKPIPLVDRPAGCALPGFDDRNVDVSIGAVPTIDKACLTQFVPIPIFPVPYIPIEDVETPCPDGFTFESETDGVGTITIAASSLQVDGPAGVTQFTRQVPSSFSKPDLGVNFSTTVTNIVVNTGGSGYVVAPTVNIGPPNVTGVQAAAVAVISGGAVIGVRITEHGYGYTSAPSATFSTGSATATASVGTSHLRRRVASVTNDNQLFLESAFPAAVSAGTSYKFHRIVITADTLLPTGGDLSFYEFGSGDPSEGCGGYFIGTINITPSDLNIQIPCGGNYNTSVSGTVPISTGGNLGLNIAAGACGNAQCCPEIQLTGPTITIPVLPCSSNSTPGTPNVTASGGVTVTRNNIDGSQTSQNITFAKSGTDCVPILTVGGGPLVIPPCPTGYTIDNTPESIALKAWNYSTATLGNTNIQHKIERTSCSIDLVRIDSNEIVIPGLDIASPYFNFTFNNVTGGKVTLNLNLTGGPAITNTQLYQDIRDALNNDPLFSPCNGCSVWA